MRTRLALILALVALPLGPDALWAQDRLAAQVETQAAARQVRALVDRAMAELASDSPDPGASALIYTNMANELAIAHPDLPLTLAYLPNLAATRAYRLRYEWANMELFAAAVLRAFDGPTLTHHPMRIEAAARLGQAMVRQGRGGEAAIILAPVVALLDGAPPSPEGDLARFWYGAALTKSRSPGWPEAGAQAFALRDSPLISALELAPFVDDYLFFMREAGASGEVVAAIAEVSAQTATTPGLHPVDRAVFLARVVSVLAENDRTAEAISISEAELAQLGAGYAGSMARNTLGMQLVRLWFQTGQISRGLAFADILLDESVNQPVPNWVDTHLLQVLRGAAFNHLGRNAEAQEAWRRGYAAVRQYERATSDQARLLAAQIDVNEPGFATFEYAGELADAGDIRTDGPVDDVLLRFLQGKYALSEQAFQIDPLTADTGDLDAVDRNHALHLALSGAGAQARQAIDDHLAYIDGWPDSPQKAAARDEMGLFAALDAFWWQGQSLVDRPDLFDDLARFATRMPPDRASFSRALRVAALNNDGRAPQMITALQEWWQAIDPNRTDHSPWDMAAAMVAVEMAYSLADTEFARKITQTAQGWARDLPPLSLTQDYLALVRLMNAPNDLETDQGLLDLGAIIQRLSAQVPRGHILRVSSRFGLAKALQLRDQLPEARSMLAAVAEALRENPDHRPDVMAFLQAYEAQVLGQMGNHDMALNLARAAFDAMTPRTRKDYRIGIVTTLAWELVHANRHMDAATLVEAQFGAPDFMDDLQPDGQVDTLRTRSTLQDMIHNTQAATALLDRAEAIIDANPGVSAGQRLSLNWDRGVQLRNAGQYEPALRYLAAANDAYFAGRARIAAASASGQAAALGQDIERVLGELTVAWWLYSERSAAPAAP